MEVFFGEIAALTTSVSWTVTSLFFATASRKVGSGVVNRIRLIIAVFFLMITHYLVTGQLLPLHVEPRRWIWLGASGIIGLAVGDALFYQALIWIGPRLTTLMMALAPIFGAWMGWILLGENLSTLEIIGMAVTLSAVAMVISERSAPGGGAVVRGRTYWLGILVGVGAAAGQALGLVASKEGLRGDFDPLSAALMRMMVAMIAIWLYAVLRRQVRPTFYSLKDRQATLAITGGAIMGPFVGVWLSLVAVQNTPVGIASTLMSLAPIFILVPSYFIYKERISSRSLCGTAVAIVGVIILLLH